MALLIISSVCCVCLGPASIGLLSPGILEYLLQCLVSKTSKIIIVIIQIVCFSQITSIVPGAEDRVSYKFYVQVFPGCLFITSYD